MSRAGWMPDSSSTQCYECGVRFTALRRKHHCRICGRIFCNQCSDFAVPGKVIGQSGFVRACEFCKKTVNECSSLNRSTPSAAQDSFSAEIDASTFTRASGANYEKDRLTGDRVKVSKYSAEDNVAARHAQPQAVSQSATAGNSANTTDDGRISHPFGATSSFANVSSNSSINDQSSEELQARTSSSSFTNAATTRVGNSPSGNESTGLLTQLANSANRDRFRLKWVEKRIPQRDVAGWLVRFRSAADSHASAAPSTGDVAQIETKLDANGPQSHDSAGVRSRSEEQSELRTAVKGQNDAARADSDVVGNDSDEENSEAEREPVWFRDIRTQSIRSDLATCSPPGDRRKSPSLDSCKANGSDSQTVLDVAAKDSREETDRSSELDCDVVQERLESSLATAASDRFGLSLALDSKSDAVQADADENDAADVCLDNENAERENCDTERAECVRVSLSETDNVDSAEANRESAENPAPPTAVATSNADANNSFVVNHDKEIRTAQKTHLLKLIRQLLVSQYLPATWIAVIYRLCKTVTRYIDPTRCAVLRHKLAESLSGTGEVDLAFNSIASSVYEQLAEVDGRVYEDESRPAGSGALVTDIREHVHIKKVPSRQQCESAVVFGVVATKNAALRSMPRAVSRPRVLVLRCSLEYQRAANKYAAFDLQIEQERDFLRNVVDRVLALRPNVVVVERAIAQLALEMMKQAGGLVVLTNVRSTVVDRLVQMTHADAVQSVEALMLVSQSNARNHLRLGTCDRFRIVELREADGSRRSLMCFEQLPRAGMAFNGTLCSVELAGAEYGELRRVKRVLRTALFAAYHGRLERAFLADSKARLRTDIVDKLADENEDEHELLARFRANQQPANAAGSPSRLLGFHFHKMAHRRKASHDPLAAITTSIANQSNLELVHESGVENDTDDSPAKDDDESQAMLMEPSAPVDASAFQPVVLRPQTFLPRSPFAQILDDVLLSVSPFVHVGMPYLQQHSVLSLLNVSPLTLVTHTPCALIVLERVDPTRLFWSAQFDNAALRENNKRAVLRKCADYQQRKQARSPTQTAVHIRNDDFLASPLKGDDLNDRLALFRAGGGSYVFDACDLRRGAPWNCSNVGVQQLAARERERAKGSENRELRTATPRDCLNVAVHQRIALLYCFFCTESPLYPAYCNEPSIVPVRFYGENDMSVRRFLTDFCFSGRTCSSCRLPVDRHIRRFVHANGCVHVSMKLIDKLLCVSASDTPKSVPDAQAKLQQLKQYCSTHIATWRRCKLCARATKIVMFSNDASQMSFGKFLEMCFRSAAYQLQPAAHGAKAAPAVCDHSLFQDFDHYFAHRERVVIIRYSDIVLREICLPPKRVARAFSLTAVQKSLPKPDEVHMLLTDVQQFYNDLFELIRMNGLMEQCFDAAKREYDVVKLRVDTLGRCVDDYAAVIRSGELESSASISSARPSISLQRSNSTLQCSITVPFTELTLEHVSLISDVYVKLQCELAIAEQTWNALLSRNASAAGVKLKRLPTNSRRVTSVATELPATKSNNSTSSPLSVPVPKRVSSLVIAINSANDCDSSVSNSLPNDDENAKNEQAPTPSTPQTLTLPPTLSDTASVDSFSTTQSSVSDVKKPRDEKSKSVLSGILRVFASEDTRVFESTYPSELHPMLPVGRVPVLVNDQQPTSIIAFALSSDVYMRQLETQRKQNLEPPPAPAQKAARNDKASARASNAIELEFEDDSTKFYCKVYYAAEFEELRRHFLIDTCSNACCSSDPEAYFIRSLSRCAKWRAPGGKSGSAFCKTSDERFVLKELNSFELQSFLHFAPHYFDYMRSHAQPSGSTAASGAATVGFTAIVKIFGFFRLGHKNVRADTSSKQDVIVMENHFYGKRLAQVFDLKGSMRNRLTKPTGGDGDYVLMDENLLKMSIVNPFYVRSHSKQALLECIRADTEFLARHEIIDYSLLVGVTPPSAPPACGELVVGIIDIIRQFTWDKRIESVVKASGLLGGKGQMPTIVNPELYRKRFIEAMHTYFLVIPDSWFALGEPIDLTRKPRTEDDRTGDSSS